MKKGTRIKCFAGVGLLAAFLLWTTLVRLVDVQPIGPCGSSVGFATLNGIVHSWTGINMTLYTLTDWLGLIPIAVALGFATFGLAQWIKRKHLLNVDRDILLLGGFYAVVLSVFVLFEVLVINYRPVLIEGFLEASYPSSTTLLVTCVIPTAMLQCRNRIPSTALKRCLLLIMAVFVAFMVIGRLLSGVHWVTDIIGGGLLSSGLVLIYDWLCHRIKS